MSGRWPPAAALEEALPDAVEEVSEEGPHKFVRVRADRIVKAARILRESCGVDMLHQVSGVDYEDRFEVVSVSMPTPTVFKTVSRGNKKGYGVGLTLVKMTF